MEATEIRPPIPASLSGRPVHGGLAVPWINSELADGGAEVADFCTEGIARHVAELHNAPLAGDQVSASRADLRAHVTALAERWERESDELRARHVAEGLHPLLASGDRDANAMRGRAADLRALLAGEPR